MKSFACVCLLLAGPSLALVPPSTTRIPVSTSSSRLHATVVRDSDTMINGDTSSPQAWDCDEDANCVQVPACDEEQCRTSLDVRIHDKWYDLSGWAKAHPAGTHWIQWYDGRDATEVMDAFHSEKGRAMYQRLPESSKENVAMLEAVTAPVSSTQKAFRKLREDLENEGFWERDMVHEATQIGLWALFVTGAAATAHSAPLVSTSLLSIAMTAAGWLGHDYIHGRSAFPATFFFTPISALIISLIFLSPVLSNLSTRCRCLCGSHEKFCRSCGWIGSSVVE